MENLRHRGEDTKSLHHHEEAYGDSDDQQDECNRYHDLIDGVRVRAVAAIPPVVVRERTVSTGRTLRST